MFGLIRKWRRRGLERQPFPREWLPHLEKHVPFFRRLPDDLRETFLNYLKVFVHEKTFTGVGGLEMNDEVRVVIAAVAVRLVLHLGLDRYDRLSEVVVYPTHYQHPERDGVVFGEANHWGTVVLSWSAVLHGLGNPRDGHDTTLHEFAHALDIADGSFDGTPELRASEDYRPWAQVLGGHFDKLQRRQRKQRKVLRDYGNQNAAEFFAVASEAFFEKPVQMRKHTPDLYDELQRFFGFDPAADGLDGVPSGRKIGRNERCPCGSGKKYKRCCLRV